MLHCLMSNVFLTIVSYFVTTVSYISTRFFVVVISKQQRINLVFLVPSCPAKVLPENVKSCWTSRWKHHPLLPDLRIGFVTA